MAANTNTSPINYNLVTQDPQLSDLLDLLKREIMLELNCHHIGTVSSFNPVNQTCVATVNYTKTFFVYNSATEQYSPMPVSYPILVDCPAIVLGGGPGYLTFPIAEGDECLLLFNDRDVDNWFQSGSTTSPVSTPRLHSFSDAIALVGLRSSQNALTNYDGTNVVLGNGPTKVKVGTSIVTIQNNTTTLNTVLQNIVTQLENLATACAAITVPVISVGAPSGIPNNSAALLQVTTQLSALASQLGGIIG